MVKPVMKALRVFNGRTSAMAKDEQLEKTRVQFTGPRFQPPCIHGYTLGGLVHTMVGYDDY
jgi:hypothetical protein